MIPQTVPSWLQSLSCQSPPTSCCGCRMLNEITWKSDKSVLYQPEIYVCLERIGDGKSSSSSSSSCQWRYAWYPNCLISSSFISQFGSSVFPYRYSDCEVDIANPFKLLSSLGGELHHVKRVANMSCRSQLVYSMVKTKPVHHPHGLIIIWSTYKLVK